MSAIDYFAWFVFITILVSAVVIVIVLAQLPGKAAAARGHPQAEAINVAGWLGMLLTVGVVWIFAMVWAYTRPLQLGHPALEAGRSLLKDPSGDAASEAEETP
ncbi:MAG: DUF3302 domain-containing protein [Woeseiaceae bacterium]|nr:DUF3302 domain-containing protein [Woeseiaceae bacterium]